MTESQWLSCPLEPQRVPTAGSCEVPGFSDPHLAVTRPFGPVLSSHHPHRTVLAEALAGTSSHVPFRVLPTYLAETGSLKARCGPRNPSLPRDGNPPFMRRTQGPGLYLLHGSRAYE